MKKALIALSLIVSIVFVLSSITISANQNKKTITSTESVEVIVSDFLADYETRTIDTNSFIVSRIDTVIGYIPTQRLYVATGYDSNNNNMYFIVDLNKANVIEFAEMPSPYSEFYDNDEVSSFYYSPLSYRVKTVDGNIIDAINNNIIVSYEDISLILNNSNLNVYGIRNERSVNSANGYILNVPNYGITSDFNDINAAIFNILKYWDNGNIPGQGTGFSNLITHSNATTRTQINNYLIANGNSVNDRTAIKGAIEDYVSDNGYDSIVEVFTTSTNMEFFDLQFEINHDYPCVIGFSPIYTGQYTVSTGVGYTTVGTVDYAIVRNWGNTSYPDISIAFNAANYICAVTIYDY